MRLRKLMYKDAEYMLEWMHDPDVVKDMQTDFSKKNLEDCIGFISKFADKVSTEMHLAIVDDADEYMGTVSLKHITQNDAEFAITVRKKAMGVGYAKYGMLEIIRIGLEELGLQNIYWCVNSINSRAVRFYEKNMFEQVVIYEEMFYQSVKENRAYTQEQIDEYKWFIVRK